MPSSTSVRLGDHDVPELRRLGLLVRDDQYLSNIDFEILGHGSGRRVRHHRPGLHHLAVLCRFDRRPLFQYRTRPVCFASDRRCLSLSCYHRPQLRALSMD